MSIAITRGWHAGHRPVCVACINPIGVRGEMEVAVLGGPVIETVVEGERTFAHFDCRRFDWWYADRTEDPTVRTLGDRTLTLLVEPKVRDYWLADPQVLYCKMDRGAGR